MPLFKRFEVNTLGRDFAVGDIHGHFSKVEALLEQLQFDKTKDRLFSVGDLIDRGPESIRALEFIDQPWFFPVMGNHEWMAVLTDIDHYTRVGNGQSWFVCLPAQEQEDIRVVFRTLPVAIQVGDIGIVHAEVPNQDWGKFVESLESLGPQVDPEIENHHELLYAIWNRRRWDEGYMAVSGIRKVIVGHTPASAIQRHKNVINLDTGSGKGGVLTIISLDTLREVASISTI